MLVIDIPKIPNICGYIFHFSLFTLHSSLTSGPLLLRFKSVSKPFQVRFMEWEVNGSYKGLTTDLLGRYIEGK